MSNLLKSGFVPFSAQKNNTEPIILDMNERAAQREKEYKVIRSVDEKSAADELAATEYTNEDSMNEAVLSDALYKAKELREDATAKALKIIADANEEAVMLREQAKEEGYNEGLSEGNMEAMRRADEYLQKMNQEQESIISDMRHGLEAEFDEKERALVDITARIIEKLTGILVDDFRPVMMHMINNALSNEDNSKKYIIRVGSKNYSYINDNIDMIAGSGNPNISIEIFEDMKLDGRQCIIETDNGIIDLSMDVQVRNLITAMKLLSEE